MVKKLVRLGKKGVSTWVFWRKRYMSEGDERKH